MNKLYALIVTVALCHVSLLLPAQYKPFPQAITYPHCIKPNHISQSVMNADVINYYNYWKATYLKNDLNSLPGGYYVSVPISGDDEGYIPISTSEGHGYGMVITVLMGGYDTAAQTIFDGLYKTARAYRSCINSNLMGWVIADVPNAQGHFDSVTDGDIDIAYSLILAHYQWGSGGNVNYLAEARKMITRGLKEANVTVSNRLNLGDWDSTTTMNTRPSDWMFSHLRAFSSATGDSLWMGIVSNLYRTYDQFSKQYSASTGLISDFVVGVSEPAPPNFLDEGPQTNEYNYNACRVPLRVSLDYALYGSQEGYVIADKIASWIIGKTGGNPFDVRDGYKLDGTVTGSDPEAVFVAPFVAAAVVNNRNQAFVNKGWEFLKNKKSGYYSDSYSLLCQLFISGNWWKPSGDVPFDNCNPVLGSSDDGHIALNVLDNDPETRWSSYGDGQYIQFCLGSLSLVRGVDIAFFSGYARKSCFDILGSVDGVKWEPILTGLESSGTSAAFEHFVFPAVSVKYVKILGHGNSYNGWNSYSEVKIIQSSVPL